MKNLITLTLISLTFASCNGGVGDSIEQPIESISVSAAAVAYFGEYLCSNEYTNEYHDRCVADKVAITAMYLNNPDVDWTGYDTKESKELSVIRDIYYRYNRFSCGAGDNDLSTNPNVACMVNLTCIAVSDCHEYMKLSAIENYYPSTTLLEELYYTHDGIIVDL